MKQTLEIKQLSELSDKGVENLAIWYVKHQRGGTLLVNRMELKACKQGKMDYGHVSAHFDTSLSDEPMRKEYEEHWIPSLSIGQMIELLTDKGLVWTHEVREPYTAETLCDALWQACKFILE